MCDVVFFITLNTMPYVIICAVHTTAGKDINVVRPSSVSNQSTKEKILCADLKYICAGISESGTLSLLPVLLVLLQ